MKHYKPSQLPAGTVIDDPKHGTWMKDSENAWHCLMRKPEWVFDYGLSAENAAAFSSALVNIRSEPADDFFQDFKVLSLPVEMVEYMALQFSKVIEVDCREFCVEQAMKHCMEEEDTCSYPKAGVLPGSCC